MEPPDPVDQASGSNSTWLSRQADTVTLTVPVQPGAAKTHVAGEHGGKLKVRVAAPPSKGRANRELTTFRAKEFGVSQSAVEVISGARQRAKRVRIHQPRKVPDWLDL